MAVGSASTSIHLASVQNFILLARADFYRDAVNSEIIGLAITTSLARREEVLLNVRSFYILLCI